ncbi:ferredoxin [Streptomyces sp. B-S-A8]|uniref:Ferredoxin n=2 Tax=Streptomyces solicavernae TaxID=3043614 RepID=A0ABT6RYR3_9ACTN|nr:ferredoxin [Streptomyces sp. B-S-A8]MDI3389560.1 ferredoxin [Streptomyces sp. B-S-A8]
MHVTVDEDKCCGAGQCTLLAPTVFDQRDDDGTVVLLNAVPGRSEHTVVQEAAGRCPSGAIRVSKSA